MLERRVPALPSLGAGDDGGGDGEGEATDMEDVQVRVFLPACPVGVARVEAVWSAGPSICCPPRHPPHFRPSLIKLNSVLGLV